MEMSVKIQTQHNFFNNFNKEEVIAQKLTKQFTRKQQEAPAANIFTVRFHPKLAKVIIL